ncbi:MAG: response regulator [Gallionellaceae bacterium]
MQAQRPSVLVVDDDSMMRELLKVILRSEDYQIAGEATNGQDAVMQCVALKPDVVLLDINMSKMNGLQALEEIRKANPTVKVLMVSADATIDRVKEAIQKGASGFVVKPLNAASVLNKIKMCLKQKEGE